MAKALKSNERNTGTQVPRGWYKQCGLTGAHKQTLPVCSLNDWLVCTCSIQNSGPPGFFLDFLTASDSQVYQSSPVSFSCVTFLALDTQLECRKLSYTHP